MQETDAARNDQCDAITNDKRLLELRAWLVNVDKVYVYIEAVCFISLIRAYRAGASLFTGY